MKKLIKQTGSLLSFCLLLIALNSNAQPIRFNFEGIDINAFISHVSVLTGKNFVVDPRVRGKITVITSKPLKGKDIYQVFLSVLEVHGYSAVPSGNVIKIVPNTLARQDSIPTNVRNTGGNQMVTNVIQIKNVSASQLIRVLRPLMPRHAHLAANDATNTLVITDRADNIKRLVKIIRRIDRVSNAEVDVIPLKHASAAEIVRILTRLQQRTGYKNPRARQRKVNLAADTRTNSVLLSGERSARLRMRAIITHMDTPLKSGGNTHVVYLRYINAKEMVKLLTGVSKTIKKNKSKGKSPQPNSNPVSIQADETNNALVITAPPDIYRSLRRVIAKLDIRRAQVLVEAVIAEVSADKARELGVQWIVGAKDGNKGAAAINNNSGSSSGGIIDMANAIHTGNVPIVGNGLSLLLGSFGKDKKVPFGALISALKSDSNTNVLSTPSILTLDNKKAEIKVGQNVPFITGSFTNTGASSGSANPFQTIQRQDVGLKLIVKPQINEGNAIMLEIDQEVSSISPSTTASDIVTNKRTIKTTVMVENGQVIVLGGLIDERVTQTRQKVPLLGSIPLLGKLFQYKKTTKEKKNLMVFLRPVIVNDAATQQSVTNSKYQYIRQQQLMIRKRGGATPLLRKNLKDMTKHRDMMQKYNRTAPKKKGGKSSGEDNYFEGDPDNDPDSSSRKKSISTKQQARATVKARKKKKDDNYYDGDPVVADE